MSDVYQYSKFENLIHMQGPMSIWNFEHWMHIGMSNVYDMCVSLW